MDQIENRVLEKPKAGFVVRGGAYIIDIFLIGIPCYLGLPLVMAKDSVDLMMGLIYLGYLWVMTSVYNATLGKMIFGLKVVDNKMNKIFWGKAFVREVLGKMASLSIGYLGFLWAAWDKDKQTWHDKIAGTYVIQDKELSKGKRILAGVLVWFVPIMIILAMVATIVLIAINPAKQYEKARETQRVLEEAQPI